MNICCASNLEAFYKTILLRLFYFFCLLSCFFYSTPIILAQENNPIRDSIYQAACAEAVQGLTPIFIGEVPVKEQVGDDPDSTVVKNYPYTIHALRHNNNWILLVVDLSGFYSYTKWADVNAFFENTPYVDYTLCEIITGNHFEKAKNKKKEKFMIGDYVFTDYYTLKKEGKKLWEQVILMEYDRKSRKNLLEKILKLDKIKEMKVTAMDQQKVLQDKIKEISDLQKQLKALNTELKILREQLEACENSEPKKNQGTDSTLVIIHEDAPPIKNQPEKTVQDTLQTTQSDTTVIQKELTAPVENLNSLKKDSLKVNDQPNNTSQLKEQVADSLKTTKEPFSRDKLTLITHQKDSLDQLLAETIDATLRRQITQAKDSLDKAYELELYLLKSSLEKNNPHNQASSNTTVNLEEAPEDIYILQQKRDSIEARIEELSQLLKKTDTFENQRDIQAELNQLNDQRADIISRMKRTLEQNAIKNN